jgi:hypothetical protein
MKSIVCTAMAMVFLGGSPVALSQTATYPDSMTESEIRQLPDAELKKRYLACSHASEQGGLARLEVRACSVVYDALLTRTFRGDYEALRAWSTPGRAVVARTTAPRRD